MQKKIRTKSIVAILVLLATTSCKKDKSTPFAVATLNVINVAAGIGNAQVITPNVKGYHSQIAGVYFGSNAVFTIPVANCPVTLYSQGDSTKAFYSINVSSNPGDIYSLFIGGANGEDEIINKDKLDYYTDSSIGVRFVNMSYNSSPVNITLSTSPTSNEFGDVAYKSITDFKKYDAHIASYTFQVKDGLGTLLASTAVPIAGADPRIHHNVTLVFKGVIGGTGASAPGMFVVKNY